MPSSDFWTDALKTLGDALKTLKNSTGRGPISRTIRIDLMSDPESKAAKGKKIVMAQSTTRHRRVRAEDDAAGGGLFFNELLQNVYDATLITDLQGHILDCSIRTTEFLLYDHNELTGKLLFDIVSGSDPQVLDSLCRSLENERFATMEAWCIRKDGTFFPSEIAVSRLHHGEPSLCLFIHDTTARRQLEQMLLAEHTAIQNADNGIAVADTTGHLEYVNPAAVRIWGYDGQEAMTSVDIRLLFQDQAKVDEMLNTLLDAGRTWVGELEAHRVTGDPITVQVSAVSSCNEEGEVVGFVLSLADISDRKRAETVVREAERQRLILETVGSACRHMSEPVTMLLTNLKLMRDMGFASDKMPELVKTSEEAVKSLDSALQRLNTTAHPGEKATDAGAASASRIIPL